jgi:hypothetical protein
MTPVWTWLHQLGDQLGFWAAVVTPQRWSLQLDGRDHDSSVVRLLRKLVERVVFCTTSHDANSLCMSSFKREHQQHHTL